MRTAAVFVALLCGAVGVLFSARGTEGQEKEKPPAQAKEKEKGQPPPPAATKWEYKLVEKGLGEKIKDIEEEFNKFGAEEWELVSPYHTTNAGSVRFLFKRPKR